MASLGSLVVSLSANTAEFTSDLGKAAHEAEKRMKDIGDAAEKMGNLMTGAFVAATGAMALMVKQSIDNADAMGKLAQSAGVAVEELSELAFAANLSDVNTESLGQSLNRLNRNISDTAAGTGEAQKAFAALGIEVKNSDGTLKNAGQVIEEVADRFAGMEDGAGKSALALMLFGRSGAQMIPLLNEGSAGIRAMREEAREFGVVVTKEAARAADQFNDNLSRLKAVQEGVAASVHDALLPMLTDFTVAALKAAKETDNFSFIGQAAVTVFQTLAVLGANVAFVFKGVGTEIGGIAAQLSALARGDIAGFSAIGKQMKEDAEAARKALDAYEVRILNLGATAHKAAVEIEKLKPPPGIVDPAVAKEQERQAAALRELMAASDELFEKDRDNTMKAMALHAEAARRQTADLAQMIEDANALYQTDAANAMAARRKQEEDRKALIQTNAIAVFDSLATERSAIEQDYAKRALALKAWIADRDDTLLEMRKKGALDEEEFNAKRIEANAVYYDAMKRLDVDYHDNLTALVMRSGTEREKFNALSMQKQAKDIFSTLANITAGVSQHNRALFEINKVAGIAMAIINAYEGISLTMAKYPFPLNLAMAAAHGLAAFAQVDAIRSASFGGGGTAPSLAGSTPAVPVTPVTGGTPGGSGQTTIINLQGETFGRSQLQDLLEQINETIGDGGRIVIA